jgi:hypothetical protein
MVTGRFCAVHVVRRGCLHRFPCPKAEPAPPPLRTCCPVRIRPPGDDPEPGRDVEAFPRLARRRTASTPYAGVVIRLRQPIRTEPLLCQTPSVATLKRAACFSSLSSSERIRLKEKTALSLLPTPIPLAQSRPFRRHVRFQSSPSTRPFRADRGAAVAEALFPPTDDSLRVLLAGHFLPPAGSAVFG